MRLRNALLLGFHVGAGGYAYFIMSVPEWYAMNDSMNQSPGFVIVFRQVFANRIDDAVVAVDQPPTQGISQHFCG